MGKSRTYTGATQTRAEARQAAARDILEAGTTGGALTSRMAGRNGGKGHVYAGGSAGGNAGSRNFLAMKADHKIDWSKVK